MFCLPKELFRGIERVTKKHGIVLIFDEGNDGFQGCAWWCAVALQYQTRLNHVRKNYRRRSFQLVRMAERKRSWIAYPPVGPVYQAGTLSGNPVAMTAGIATLRNIKR